MSGALPYFLGCPSWSDPAWADVVFPRDATADERLAHYCRRFNAVEGNTTFYASPSAESVQRWAGTLPADFRFCAKLPREISHGGDLREQGEALDAFLGLMAPLGERLQPYWLQLPASFGPARLPELAEFITRFPGPLAVELRHPAFFDRGDDERALNRLLQACGVERICLDSRALFACRDDSPAVVHAQTRKPRLPVRPTAFSDSPQLRFVGDPQLDANDPFLAPWVAKVAGWIEQGLRPCVFMHTADNRQAPLLAGRFHQLLTQRLPGLPELEPFTAPQLALL